jgi:hypothetical protein
MYFYRQPKSSIKLNVPTVGSVYTEESVALEAIVPTTNLTSRNPKDWIESILGNLFFTVSCLGGVLQTQPSVNQRTIQIILKVPYVREQLGERLQIKCRLPLLQQAFTHLAFSAGLRVCHSIDEDIPLLTDEIAQIQSAKRGAMDSARNSGTTERD